MTSPRVRGVAGSALLGLLLLACSPQDDPQSGDSQTNWLSSCRGDEQCGDMKCLCGVCTRPCGDTNTCVGPSAACVGADEPAAIAQCSGSRPSAPGLCLPRCVDGGCTGSAMCVAGFCTTLPEATANVTIDLGTTHQVLVGFGATIAYGETEVTGHPQQAAIYQALFGDLGLDVLRFRNRYRHLGDDDLTASGQLFAGASSALGHAPTTFLSSWSPPASLKANGAVTCSGFAQTCTLGKTPAGAFDYAGFADYWRSSLTAYSGVGIVPDYVGLQNNVNWAPSSAELGEACKFLPVEGTATVSINGSDALVPYPGLAQAQAATIAALATLPTRPQIIAPETSDFASVADYLPSLDLPNTAALAHHFYGLDPDAVDLDALSAIGQLESQLGRPVFVTEMQADGFATALLIHYALVVEGASAYLQAALTGPVAGPVANPQALLGLDVATFSPQDPYHALRHFARSTDPGWTRVEATSDVTGLLVSAWRSPSERDLTLVLINAGSVELSAQLALPGTWTTSAVTRSVFSGVERSAALGQLSSPAVVRLPPRSVLTVALSR